MPNVISAAVTDITKAKAGDVLDLGQGARYRYLLLSEKPTYRGDGLWSVAGRRWMKSRQAFAQSGISFRASVPREVSDAEIDAHIARLAAADEADGIE